MSADEDNPFLDAVREQSQSPAAGRPSPTSNHDPADTHDEVDPQDPFGLQASDFAAAAAAGFSTRTLEAAPHRPQPDTPMPAAPRGTDEPATLPLKLAATAGKGQSRRGTKATAAKPAKTARKTRPAARKTATQAAKEATAAQATASRPQRPQAAEGATGLPVEQMRQMHETFLQAEPPHADRLPKKLSPSRATDFKKCPQAFYFKTIVGIPSPNTIPTALGTVSHTAFERIFDHPRGERTEELALSYIAPAWEVLVNPLRDRSEVEPGSAEDRIRQESGLYRDQVEPGSADERMHMASAAGYRELCAPGSAEERDLLDRAEQMVRNWFRMERVNNFDPADRELYLAAEVCGVTVHGYIDRLDRFATGRGTEDWYVSDYKTGKPFDEGKRYSPEVMRRIAEDAFFQLKVYAVLIRKLHGITVKALRLIYVRTGSRENGIKTLAVTPGILDATEKEIEAIWRGISEAAQNQHWPPNALNARGDVNKLCSWCSYLPLCTAFSDAGDEQVPSGAAPEQVPLPDIA